MKTLFLSLLCLCFTLTGAAQERIAIQHGPYLQNLKETEVTIVWKANKPSVGWVELAPDDGSDYYARERTRYFDATNGVKNTSLVHVAKITGLTPGTSYRYRVYAQEVLDHEWVEVTYGKTAATDVYGAEPLTFTTNDRNKPETSFLMINDIHGRTADIPRLLDAGGYKNTDLVIFNGDMLSQLKDEESLFTGFMDVSVELFAKEKPMYYARGNHETRGLFATSFQHYFSPKEPHLYFLLRQGPVCFVFLDTGEDKPDSDIEYSGITDYDRYRTEQAQWLAEAVKSKEFTEARFKVVIAHMPPLPDKRLWHGQLEVLEKFVPVLNRAAADVMLCGHLHRYFNNKPTGAVKFPVIDNSYNTVLTGVTKGNELTLEVKDLEGKTLDRINITAR
ncbi:MAG: metallophosphoesterase [Parabacteroides sp.]|nr:metallophosphoesterase [Parabacteroides sp.]